MKSKIMPLTACAALIALASCDLKTGESSSDITFSHMLAAEAYTYDVPYIDMEGNATDSTTTIRYACRADMLLPTDIFGKQADAFSESIKNVAFGSETGPTAISDFFKDAVAQTGYDASPLVLTDTALDSLKNNMSALRQYDGFTLVEGYIESMTPRIISYAVNSSQYTPMSAHGMYSTRFINYDIRNNKVFQLEDIVESDSLTSMPAIIAQIANSISSMIGETTIDCLPAGGNFSVSASGDLIFVYQPYDVASYAQGEIRIPVKPYMIEAMLTPYGRQLLLNE